MALLALAHLARIVTQRNAHSIHDRRAGLVGPAPDLHRAGARSRAAHRPCMTPEALERALDATPGAVGAPSSRPLFRRDGRCGRAGRGRSRAQGAADRGRGVGSAPRFHPTYPRARFARADLVISSVHKSSQPAPVVADPLGRASLLELDVVDRCVTLLESTAPTLTCTPRSTRRDERRPSRGAALGDAERASCHTPGGTRDPTWTCSMTAGRRPRVFAYTPATGHRRARNLVQRLRPPASCARSTMFRWSSRRDVMVAVFGMGRTPRPPVSTCEWLAGVVEEERRAAEMPSALCPPPVGRLVRRPARRSFARIGGPAREAIGRSPRSRWRVPARIPNVLRGSASRQRRSTTSSRRSPRGRCAGERPRLRPARGARA